MAWHPLRIIIAGMTASLATAGVTAGFIPPAQAFSIELKDAAHDRIERQRAAAEGRLPLPDTPDIARLAERLEARGLKAGSPVYIRIFKAQSELEIWIERDGTYHHFATYPVCHWSGTLGPKLRQGDKQAPEGFYTVASDQINRSARWPLSLNLGYPNPFDRSQARSGSHILVHGGCSSVGCFAMTNPVMGEIHLLTSAAVRAGQMHVPVHVFPFRMTAENIERYRAPEWQSFWENLKEGHDLFERTRRPPKVTVCADKYHFVETAANESATPGPLSVCSQTTAQIEEMARFAELVPPEVLQRLLASARAGLGISASLAAPSLRAIAELAAEDPIVAANFHSPRDASIAGAPRRRYNCSPGLASCRKHIALQERIATRRAYAGSGKKRLKTAQRQ